MASKENFRPYRSWTQVRKSSPRCHHTPIRMAKLEHWKQHKLVRMWGQHQLSFLAGENSTATLEDALAVSYKTKPTLTISGNCVPSYLPKKLKTWGHAKICTQLFLAALFIIAKTWRQPRCLLSGWMDKQWYMQTMFSSKKKWSSHEKPWKNLKCILLSENSQSKEASYCMIPSMWHSRKSKDMERLKGSVVPQ